MPIMGAVVNLLFEARMLKEIPRSGYHFLGSGRESVAEHSFLTTIIAYTLAQMVPEADELKLLRMCLIHDLPEARIGDLNYVQKRYITPDEQKAVADMTANLPFGNAIKEALDEFNAGQTLEARLAKDADQLALTLELKALRDRGSDGPQDWLPHVKARLKTAQGKALARQISKTASDAWWFEEKGKIRDNEEI